MNETQRGVTVMVGLLMALDTLPSHFSFEDSDPTAIREPAPRRRPGLRRVASVPSLLGRALAAWAAETRKTSAAAW